MSWSSQQEASMLANKRHSSVLSIITKSWNKILNDMNMQGKTGIKHYRKMVGIKSVGLKTGPIPKCEQDVKMVGAVLDACLNKKVL